MKKTVFRGMLLALLTGASWATPSEVLNNRAIEIYTGGQVSEALSLFDKAIRQSPERAIFYNNRGVIKAAMGDLFGALADYNKVIEMDGDAKAKALAYYNRARLKMKDNLLDEAISDFTRAIESNPKYAPAYKARAEAKQKSAEADLKRHKELSD